ncbi:MAG: ABC transporter ATP-binding protein [Bdellovibrionota bacterium]|nr:multidrug ABC transporter ATP-binding protein [Pseudobdellovibrionaceae bacterium]|tara:strand:- start:51816 stop:52727 length:912 start_codon:yes stop_codon:yes gene_type:complete
MIQVQNLNKQYADGKKALSDVNLEIKKGEIYALLGPNGAGKTTMISIICGLVNPSSGKVKINGFDIIDDYREARSLIGLVPQELTTDAFETVWNTVNFSRSLFGKPKNHAFIEKILKDLSLWDKKDNQLMTLSGGMKRRVMIAKALSHEPSVLFLDEPTAGVDVELRKSMWDQVSKLRESGVTIILTTHYIEEAEEMADRVGVISGGKLILTEPTKTLMKKLGKKQMLIELEEKISEIPEALKKYELSLGENKQQIHLNYDIKNQDFRILEFFEDLKAAGVRIHDLSTRQSSLEEIFIELVKQ